MICLSASRTNLRSGVAVCVCARSRVCMRVCVTMTFFRASPPCELQVTIHTDTLNESCSLEGSVAAFKGRTIHTYHSEGAGGGHAPDIIAVCGEPNVIPSSTNPTRYP